jgi:processive 1,2-diacylglycerol beta-glucosyltransferase
MKTIGIFTSGYGHQSIAQAIAEKIEENASDRYRVKLFFRKEPLDLLYSFFYRFIPSSFGSVFRLFSSLTKKDQFSRKLVEAIFKVSDEKKVRAFIKNNKIDLCIGTYLVFNPILEKLQDEGLPFINVLADPKTLWNLGISEKALVSMVFDKEVSKKYKDKNMIPTGWFVRKKFEEKYQQSEIRKKLKIDNNLTILMVSGSEGSNTILKILPSIINCDKKTNFIIACGNNKFLYENMLGIKHSLLKLSSSKAELRPLSHTKNLHLYMQASDLVIGKAGPNTLFESIACKKAFFAITHIHGQEDGNLDIIRDYKIGFVEENTEKANKKLTELIKKPSQIKKFAPNINALKKYNQNSIKILLKTIDRLLQIH